MTAVGADHGLASRLAENADQLEPKMKTEGGVNMVTMDSR